MIQDEGISGSTMLKIQGVYSSLKSAEKRLADYIIANQVFAINLTINQLATQSDSSYATIIRFCKKLGFTGYKDFRKCLVQDIAKNNSRNQLLGDLHVDMNRNLEEVYKQIFSNSISLLQESASILDSNTISSVTKCMMNARHICFIGAGASGISARYAYSRFFRIGLSCSYDSDYTLYRMRVATLQEGDVLFAISSSGRTEEIVKCSRYAKEKGITVISLSDYAISPLTKNSDYKLFTTPRNASLFQTIDMPLCICQLAIIDALYACCCNQDIDQCAVIYQKTKESADVEKLNV